MDRRQQFLNDVRDAVDKNGPEDPAKSTREHGMRRKESL